MEEAKSNRFSQLEKRYSYASKKDEINSLSDYLTVIKKDQYEYMSKLKKINNEMSFEKLDVFILFFLGINTKCI